MSWLLDCDFELLRGLDLDGGPSSELLVGTGSGQG